MVWPALTCFCKAIPVRQCVCGSGRAFAHIDKPALTFGLALQPGVLADVASSRRFRDSGLLARFLYAMPESTVGKQRDVRQRLTISRMILNEYESRLFGLLEGRELSGERAARDRNDRRGSRMLA